LIEVLVVVALVSLMTGMIVSGTGMLSSTRQRSAATLVMMGIRTGITHANTTGLPARLVFDLEKDRISLEETRGRMLRRMSDEDSDDSSAGAEPATVAEKAAAEEAKEILDGPREAPPSFTPVEAFSGESEDPEGGRPLGRAIQFESVHTEHDHEPRTEGRAYLYFWPGGGTEKAVIKIRRDGETEGLSVVVSPLTGRAQIVRGAVDLDKPGNEVDFGEREEE
jgi:general secretion pathway protein H